MKTIVNGYFDEIELSDTAYFGNPIITDTTIVIPTRNITLSEGHPLNKTGKPLILPEGKLCFSGVTKSERDIAEYIGDPKSGSNQSRQLVRKRAKYLCEYCHSLEYLRHRAIAQVKRRYDSIKILD